MDSTPLLLWIVAGLCVLLALAIWSIKRHRDPHLRVQADAPIEALLPSMTGLSLGAMVEGNAVELLECNDFFDALLADIQAAKASVHFETFLWKDGELGRRLAAALTERARAGVHHALGGGNSLGCGVIVGRIAGSNAATEALSCS